jgi:hypothetical protein
MFAKLSSLARSGLIALSVVGGLTVTTAVAGPASLAPNPATYTAGNVISIQGDGRYSDCMRGGDCWEGRKDRRWSRDHYRRDRNRGWRDRDRDWSDRDWRGRHWRSDRQLDNNRYWRRHHNRDRDRHHRHHRRYNDGPSFRIYLN